MYNPYMPQQFPQNLAGMQPQMANPYARQEVIRVSGEDGAKAYQMAPNSSALLLDEQNPIVYLKTTDGAGYPTLNAYSIAPYKAPAAPDYNSLEARIQKLEEMLNAKSNAAAVDGEPG